MPWNTKNFLQTIPNIKLFCPQLQFKISWHKPIPIIHIKKETRKKKKKHAKMMGEVSIILISEHIYMLN